VEFIPAYVYEEDDAHDATWAKMHDVGQNMLDGQASALEVAFFVRNSNMGRDEMEAQGYLRPGSANVMGWDIATLAGDVVLAAGSSVWYGAVVRGDTGAIRIGKNSNIQDNAVLHTGPNLGVTIGKNVSIGHSAVVHGCTVGDGALIGMHATVMNGAVVGKNAVVAAGALVLENTVVPDGMVAMGVPAKVREAASPALVEANRKNAEGYVAEATAHAEANK